MTEKENNSFVRASQANVKVEQDLGPAVLEEEIKPAIVRASARPIIPGEEVDPEIIKQLGVKQLDEEKTPEVVEEKQPEKIKVSIKEKKQEVSEEGKKIMDMLKKSNEEKENLFELIEEKVEIPLDLQEIKRPVDEVKEEVKEEKLKKKAKTIDLESLTILNKNEIDKERDLRQALYNNKAAFQIVAAQSGYMAKVSPLVHKDLVNMLYGNLGRYEYKKSVYRVVWEKMFETSVGKLSFDEFLKYTSVEDMETFFYGIYSSTFPNEGTFKYYCEECGSEHEYKVNHGNLIKTTDRDHMKKLIDEVSKNSTSFEKMKEYSLLGKGEAIQLSESGLIFELKTPSLFDSLEILRTVPEETIDKDAVSVTNMLYVNRVLIPDKEKIGYTEESKKTSLLRIIDNLSIDDANELQNSIFDKVDENRISYSIKNIKCHDCGTEVKDIPISIEDILFTLIFEKVQ
jgi:hypothetical protein